MRRKRDDTELWVRELLAVDSSRASDQTSIDVVRRQLDAVRSVLRFDAEMTPSDPAIRRANAIFQPRVASAPVTAMQRLRARLTFDSRTAQPGLGFRGGASATLLRYEVDGILIDLEIGTRGEIGQDRVSLTGQIDGAPDETAEAVEAVEIELRGAGDEVLARTTQDAFGAFTLTVDAGDYDVVARFGTTEITIPDVPIR